jgi:hypothetical protein
MQNWRPTDNGYVLGMHGCRSCHRLGSGFGFNIGTPTLPTSGGGYVKAADTFVATASGPPPPAPIMATTFEATTQALDAATGRDDLLRIDPGGMYARASQKASPVPAPTVEEGDASFDDRSDVSPMIDDRGGVPGVPSSYIPEKQETFLQKWGTVIALGGAALVAGYFIQRMF